MTHNKQKLVEFVGGGPLDGKLESYTLLKDQSYITIPVRFSRDPLAFHRYERITDYFFMYKGIVIS